MIWGEEISLKEITFDVLLNWKKLVSEIFNIIGIKNDTEVKTKPIRVYKKKTEKNI